MVGTNPGHPQVLPQPLAGTAGSMLEGCEVVASTGPMQKVPAPRTAPNGATSASPQSSPTAAAAEPWEPEGHPGSSQKGMDLGPGPMKTLMGTRRVWRFPCSRAHTLRQGQQLHLPGISAPFSILGCNLLSSFGVMGGAETVTQQHGQCSGNFLRLLASALWEALTQADMTAKTLLQPFFLLLMFLKTSPGCQEDRENCQREEFLPQS